MYVLYYIYMCGHIYIPITYLYKIYTYIYNI